MSNNNDNNIYSLIFLPDIESIEMWSRMFSSSTNQPTNQPMTQWLSDVRESQSAILLRDLFYVYVFLVNSSIVSVMAGDDAASTE